MSWRKADSPGWASIDLNQQQQREDGSAYFEAFGHLKEQKKPSFPPIPSTANIQEKKNHFIPPVKSFSSVLLPPAAKKFPALPGAASTSRSTPQSNSEQACVRIKELYDWADESLITDVLAAVDNDINEASALLAEMASSECTEQKKDKSVQVSSSHAFLLQHNDCDNKGTSLEELNCHREGSLNYANREFSYRDEGSDQAAALKNFSFEHLNNVPAEPEWEEDDIYIIHRKEALHKMRSASQHSRKASDAYMRGDHFAAQELSAKAREEWTAAEKLNAKAADDILHIRNKENDPWKLDLHGLHALEAVKALQERLQKLEHLVSFDRSLSPNGRNSKKTTGGSIVRCSSLECLTRTSTGGTVNIDGRPCGSSSLQQRRTMPLHVITGVGNHSRGEAALPTAIRNFLNENGYRYDEARPGLISVRPKFRNRRALDKSVG